MTLPCSCPETYPDWDGQDIDLGGSAVLALPIPTFLHMPMGYEVYLGRLNHLLQHLDVKQRWPGLVLTRTGWWRGEILSVLSQSNSPSHLIRHLPSPFRLRARLHKGDVGTIRTSVREMQSQLLDAGRMPKELYLSYLTCPTCAEGRGGAKIMLLRRWEESPTLVKRLAKQR